MQLPSTMMSASDISEMSQQTLHMTHQGNDIGLLIANTMQVENATCVGSNLSIEKVPVQLVSLQTVDGVGRINPEMDALGLVIEEVQIMEEVEWHQDGVALQNQYQQLCRICALETSELVSVFGEEGSILRLAEKIYWYLPIEVKESDKLPLAVCTTCVAKLNSCHDLTVTCFEANEKLKKMFSVNNENTDSNASSNEGTSEQHLPLDQLLSRAMEILKKTKDYLLRKLVAESQGSTENVEHLLHKNFVQLEPQFDDRSHIGQQYDHMNHLSSSNIKTNSVESVDDIKSEPSEFYDVNEDMLVYKRPQRQIKRKFPEDCEFLVKPEFEDTVQNEIESEPRKKRKIQKEWKCQTCGIVFEKKSSLIIHQQRKHLLKNFVCSYCDKTFRNRIAMRSHERSHTKMLSLKNEIITYICEYCGKSFRGKKTLKEHHLANHSDERPFKCDKCEKTYGSVTSLDIHKATHSNETPFLCDLCGKSFKHVSNLRSHKRSHMEKSHKNKQVCDVCGKGFRTRFHLSEHMNVHSGRRPYVCNVCGKHFHKKIQLRQHGSAHSGVQPFKCHLCGVRFNRRGNMTQHLKRHDRERKYTCRVCNEGFATLGAVLSHRKRHSKEEVEISIKQNTGTAEDPEQVAYKCEVCNKLLAKKDSLAVHMRSHTGEKPFECGVCGKRLSNKGSLSYHMRSFHTGERPHTCQYCGEGFLSRESRLVHERIHTGEKPYICSSCGMGFRCSSNLAQHSRIHSETRPHACPHCEKRFQRKGALDVHIRTHTGERPYACDICGRRFTQKNDMLKHRRTHSPDEPTACPQCGELFNHKRELNKHLLLHITNSQHVVDPTTQTVLITTADNIIAYPEINVPVMENTHTLVLHRY